MLFLQCRLYYKIDGDKKAIYSIKTVTNDKVMILFIIFKIIKYFIKKINVYIGFYKQYNKLINYPK